jgi:hypothetical protein
MAAAPKASLDGSEVVPAPRSDHGDDIRVGDAVLSSGEKPDHPCREIISPVSTFTGQRKTIRQRMVFQHLVD